ncbi:MAG: class I SAM-dependent methyltransferase [Planctomycetes bacterium]|nr:class I SAM-dependent methyltransferase [Planctomycetota bacterium]
MALQIDWYSYWETQWYDARKVYEQMHSVIVENIPADRDTPLCVMDVGGGSGTLIRRILETFPRSTAVYVDKLAYPELKKEVVEQMLGGFADKVAFLWNDFGSEGWDVEITGPLDVIVSNRAIHHLEDHGKQQLYRQIFGHLRPGGVFLLGEEVKIRSERWVGAFQNHRIESARRAHRRREEFAKEAALIGAMYHRVYREPEKSANKWAFLDQQLQWLADAGFTDIQTLWQFYDNVVIGAYKPE